MSVQPSGQSSHLGFLRNRSETDSLIQNFAWASTPLGPMESWPQSRKTFVSSILQSAVPIVTLWGGDGVMIYNDAYSRFAGARHPLLLGSKVREGWPEVAGFNDNVMKVCLSGGTLSYKDQELTLHRKGVPEQVWMNLDYSPILNENGEPAGVLAIVIETTDRVLADRERRISEQRFRGIAEAMPGFVFTASAEGSIDYVSPNRMGHGENSTELSEGKKWLSFVHPEDLERTINTWQQAVATGEPFELEYRLRDAEGAYRWWLSQAVAVRGLEGKIERWAGLGFDFQQIVQARERLKRSYEELEREVARRTYERDRMWRLATDALLVADPETTINAVNPAWTRILGWQEDELIGKRFLELVHPDDLPATIAEVGDINRGETTFRFENRYRRKDGSYCLISWMAVADSGSIFGVGRDITADKEAAESLAKSEEVLRQAQKMEAVGQLTGGLAHDFNNLLTGVTGSLEIMQKRLTQGRLVGIERYIDVAQGAARRAASLTQRLLAFSRRQTLSPKPTDANRLISGMEDLIRRTIGPSIELEVIGAGGLWSTLIDPPQLENALLNLCINARDAMPDGGRVTIETANKWLDERAASERELPSGQYISVCVTDTGIGMTPEVVARVFDPFFTTKPIGEGTGLGLSMVYGFARQSGGQVRVYSELGTGTTMCLYLPRNYRALADDSYPQEQKAANAVADGKAILIVDDEASIRALLCEILNEEGYTTLEAADGPAGLRILQSDTKIDLLITDVGLPGGMNGRQVADAGRTFRPGLKVLFITGYAENAVIGNGHLEPGMQVITKPFPMATLTSTVRTIIEPASHRN